VRDPFLSQLLTHGILQVGHFPTYPHSRLLRAQFELLVSYPSLLQQMADVVAERISHLPAVDRLVCVADMTPLGVLLSQRLGMPLVYSRGCGGDAIQDLVGAYDVGHPTLLLISAYSHQAEINKFIQRGQSVGLIIGQVLACIAFEPLPNHIQALYTMDDIFTSLQLNGSLPKQSE
jgi:hypothetical protein